MTYRAKDLWEAAFLMTKGLKPAGTVTEGKWICFAFEDGDGRVSQASTEYLGRPKVDLHEFREYHARLRKTVDALMDALREV